MGHQPATTWKKRILLPIWIVRVLAMLFTIVIYGLALKLAKDQYGYSVNLGYVRSGSQGLNR